MLIPLLCLLTRFKPVVKVRRVEGNNWDDSHGACRKVCPHLHLAVRRMAMLCQTTVSEHLSVSKGSHHLDWRCCRVCFGSGAVAWPMH